MTNDARHAALARAVRTATEYRLVIAETEARCQRARAKYRRALRQATAAGASRRSLAQALGVSPSRVQQILEAEA